MYGLFFDPFYRKVVQGEVSIVSPIQSLDKPNLNWRKWIMENKKYYWIISGDYYEVSKETYQKLKKNYDHHRMLREYEAEVTVLSLDATTSDNISLYELIPDPNTNVEEDAIHNVLLEKMRIARDGLSPDERLLLELLFEQNKSQDEASKLTGIPQSTISYRLEKILNKMRKLMGVNKKFEN